MKIKELIEKLNHYPQEMDVWVDGVDGDREIIKLEVETPSNFPVYLVIVGSSDGMNLEKIVREFYKGKS